MSDDKKRELARKPGQKPAPQDSRDKKTAAGPAGPANAANPTPRDGGGAAAPAAGSGAGAAGAADADGFYVKRDGKDETFDAADADVAQFSNSVGVKWLLNDMQKEMYAALLKAIGGNTREGKRAARDLLNALMRRTANFGLRAELDATKQCKDTFDALLRLGFVHAPTPANHDLHALKHKLRVDVLTASEKYFDEMHDKAIEHAEARDKQRDEEKAAAAAADRAAPRVTHRVACVLNGQHIGWVALKQKTEMKLGDAVGEWVKHFSDALMHYGSVPVDPKPVTLQIYRGEAIEQHKFRSTLHSLQLDTPRDLQINLTVSSKTFAVLDTNREDQLPRWSAIKWVASLHSLLDGKRPAAGWTTCFHAVLRGNDKTQGGRKIEFATADLYHLGHDTKSEKVLEELLHRADAALRTTGVPRRGAFKVFLKYEEATEAQLRGLTQNRIDLFGSSPSGRTALASRIDGKVVVHKEFLGGGIDPQHLLVLETSIPMAAASVSVEDMSVDDEFDRAVKVVRAVTDDAATTDKYLALPFLPSASDAVAPFVVSGAAAAGAAGAAGAGAAGAGAAGADAVGATALAEPVAVQLANAPSAADAKMANAGSGADALPEALLKFVPKLPALSETPKTEADAITAVLNANKGVYVAQDFLFAAVAHLMKKPPSPVAAMQRIVSALRFQNASITPGAAYTTH